MQKMNKHNEQAPALVDAVALVNELIAKTPAAAGSWVELEVSRLCPCCHPGLTCFSANVTLVCSVCRYQLLSDGLAFLGKSTASSYPISVAELKQTMVALIHKMHEKRGCTHFEKLEQEFLLLAE